MATLGSPEISPKRRPRTWARRIERLCVAVFGYVPLAFVYGLTSWAVWVQAGIGFLPNKSSWIGFPSSALGITLYILLNLSYTVAVFTDPGSPLTSSTRSSGRGQYSHLPTTELPEYQSYTVNSHGGARYCKKCQCAKPDRAHHCSNCKRCVLKMDHHCPWLATCVGLRNYKAFLLFLIYTSIFCWVCFGTASMWVWQEVLTEMSYIETLMPVNVILLAIIGGIIGLVLTGFTAWHISLALRNLTTIESLEKTRYLSPLRNALDRHRSDNHDHSSDLASRESSFSHRLQGYGQQIIDAHANAIPGVTRVEEGEERQSPVADNRASGQHPQDYMSFLHESNSHGTPAQQALHRSYEEMERQRERDRYEDYLDSRDNEAMPSPFDHGWRRNLLHLFGENPFLWALPVCNTSGDGWFWEPSIKFLDARERVRKNREQEWSQWLERQRQQSYEYWTTSTGQRQPVTTRPVSIQRQGKNIHSGSLGASLDRPSTGVSMKTLRPMSPRIPHDDDSDDDSSFDEPRPKHLSRQGSKAERVLGISRDDVGTPREEWRNWD